MIYNVLEGKLADALQIMDKLQQLSPQALAYVEGAVNMAVLMSTASVDLRTEAAMLGGALRGWDSPWADPAHYDDAGAYVGPESEADNG